MNRQQFRVLYRQFLFRLFDLELLSPKAEGSESKLLGQLAAILVFVSAVLAFSAVFSNPDMPWASGLYRVEVNMTVQHFLIATTMLTVSLFAVLSWDSVFPDQRDLTVLGPLPVNARTMFGAKLAAVTAALGLTIMLLHSVMGWIWPFVFLERGQSAVFPTLRLDPTPTPVSAGGLKAVMDRDLGEALRTELAPDSGLGMAIGVWKQGERRVFTYGMAQPDSIFEIGSATKTFTGVLLAQMAVQGTVRLDQPVRELLARDITPLPARPSTELEITLLDLATHYSGLPGIPDNFRPGDRADPYADYGSSQLYAYFSAHGFSKPFDASFNYSNLGMGLLGYALGVRAGSSYADQLRKKITGPLGMNDTTLHLSNDQQRRFLQGHDPAHRPVHAWNFDALAGAGAIRSTAGDMLVYLEANLHPERYPALTQALLMSHQVRAQAKPGEIGLGWLYSNDTGTWGHDGGTAGFSSEIFFNPAADCAAVVLINSGQNALLSNSLIGQHILQRLRGDPAIALDTVSVPTPTGVFGLFRSFAAYWLTMLLAGAFAAGSILMLQGATGLLLPRRLFLRFSGLLQSAAVCLIIAGYFLEPGFAGLQESFVPSMGRVIQRLPSHWFLALYQQLNGSMHPALQSLATRAWIGLGVVFCCTPLIYALSYRRLLRAIVEEPDLSPPPPRWRWSFRNPITEFTLQTLLRSRQHRLILSFYLGIGLAFTSLVLKAANPAAIASGYSRRSEAMLLWGASFVVMSLAILGTRVAFGMPFDLRANWIFRIAGGRSAFDNLAAVRRAIYGIAVVPVWLLTAAVCLTLWPSRENAGHLAVLALFSVVLTDACLFRFRKIPFTCSWLPGKSKVNIAFAVALGLLVAGRQAAEFERTSLQTSWGMFGLLAILALAAICLRRTVVTSARRMPAGLEFEEDSAPQLITLQLHQE